MCALLLLLNHHNYRVKVSHHWISYHIYRWYECLMLIFFIPLVISSRGLVTTLCNILLNSVVIFWFKLYLRYTFQLCIWILVWIFLEVKYHAMKPSTSTKPACSRRHRFQRPPHCHLSAPRSNSPFIFFQFVNMPSQFRRLRSRWKSARCFAKDSAPCYLSPRFLLIYWLLRPLAGAKSHRPSASVLQGQSLHNTYFQWYASSNLLLLNFNLHWLNRCTFSFFNHDDLFVTLESPIN
jgi:hypothetical protein